MTQHQTVSWSRPAQPPPQPYAYPGMPSNGASPMAAITPPGASNVRLQAFLDSLPAVHEPTLMESLPTPMAPAQPLTMPEFEDVPVVLRDDVIDLVAIEQEYFAQLFADTASDGDSDDFFASFDDADDAGTLDVLPRTPMTSLPWVSSAMDVPTSHVPAAPMSPRELPRELAPDALAIALRRMMESGQTTYVGALDEIVARFGVTPGEAATLLGIR